MRPASWRRLLARAGSWLGAVLLLGAAVRACRIQGVDIGVCNKKIGIDELYRLSVMPFCGPHVRYTPCVPKYAPLPPSREHPLGRWWNHTITHKDDWVRKYYEKTITQRVSIERDKQLQKYNVDEFGGKGAPVPRFYKNDDCMDAFKYYLCYVNFPRCDEESGETLMTCNSACENMMISCRLPKDLWRCGPSEYLNGYEPESASFVSGVAQYLRDFYPGQPFEANQFTEDRKKDPVPVCTPSLDGPAAAVRPPLLAITVPVGLAALLLARAAA